MNTTRSRIPGLAAVLLLSTVAPPQEGVSSFGHARTRALAELGRLPAPADVAVADIVNYHRHRLPLPAAGDAVMLEARFGGTGLDRSGRAVLQLGYTTQPATGREDLPPLDLALVIDTSGSMGDAGKMDAVQQALAAFVGRLRAEDRVALVGYASDAALLEPCRSLGDGHWLRAAIARLQPNGSTNLHAGLMLGLRQVAAAPGRGLGTSRRVILLTDGIANCGVTDPQEILDQARALTAEGIDLSTIGVGQDINTALLERLARGGRGLFHFVADCRDIDKVFVAEVQSLVAPAARDCRLEVQLPPGLELETVFGHRVQRSSDGWLLELPDLNRGATAVVLATVRAAGDRQRPSRGRVAAGLRYRDAATGELRTCRAEAVLDRDPAGAADPLADPEVRKNFTIARLAQAMHDMAELADQRRWVDADRTLRAAIDQARQRFDRDDDADVRSVLTMAEEHRATLRGYLDRFRDV